MVARNTEPAELLVDVLPYLLVLHLGGAGGALPVLADYGVDPGVELLLEEA